jgi:hypothetical protein
MTHMRIRSKRSVTHCLDTRVCLQSPKIMESLHMGMFESPIYLCILFVNQLPWFTLSAKKPFINLPFHS